MLSNLETAQSQCARVFMNKMCHHNINAKNRKITMQLRVNERVKKRKKNIVKIERINNNEQALSSSYLHFTLGLFCSLFAYLSFVINIGVEC